MPRLPQATLGTTAKGAFNKPQPAAQPSVPARQSTPEVDVLAGSGYYNYQLLHKSTRSQGDGLALLQHVVQSFESLHRLQGDFLIEGDKPELVSFVPTPGKLVLVMDLDETLVHCCNFDPVEQQVNH